MLAEPKRTAVGDPPSQTFNTDGPPELMSGSIGRLVGEKVFVGGLARVFGVPLQRPDIMASDMSQ